MRKIVALGAMLAVALPFAVAPAQAVSSSSAREICMKEAAKQHSDLLGNVQVRRVVAHKSGYEVNLQVKGVEINCMLTSSGKVRYIN